MSSDREMVPYNFLGLPADESGYADSRVVVLPVPYEGTVTYRGGTRLGPQAIIMASREVELYDPRVGCEPGTELGVHTLGELAFDASGPAATLDAVRQAAGRVVADGKFLVTLGGEHSITAPLVDVHRRRTPELSVLQIDAHLDLRDKYLGTPHNHACVMRRLVDAGVPVQAVGIRNVSAEEAAFVETSGLKPVMARDVGSDGRWIRQALDGLGDAVYVTIDLDGLDPSVIRSVGTPEPGGLSWYDVLDLLAAVAAERRIVGFDCVELCPQPGDVASDFAAAVLCYRLLSLAHFPPS